MLRNEKVVQSPPNKVTPTDVDKREESPYRILKERSKTTYTSDALSFCHLTWSFEFSINLNALKNFEKFVSKGVNTQTITHNIYTRTLDLSSATTNFNEIEEKKTNAKRYETNARLRNEKPPCTDERLIRWVAFGSLFQIALRYQKMVCCRVDGVCRGGGRSHIGTGRHSVEYVVVRIRLEVRYEEKPGSDLI